MKGEMWDETTAKLPPNPCPVCGKENDAATSSTTPGTFPSPGDLSICHNCISILIFKEDLTTREFTAEEFVELPVDERSHLKMMQESILEVKQMSKEDLKRLRAYAERGKRR
jgi:hypothetical protein